MQTRINPISLKGHEVTDRMIHLMNINSVNENKNDNVMLKRLLPNGKTYGIVKESHNYFIKISDKRNPSVDDFKYIGGLENKIQEAYGSYSKALKQLNLKLVDINEACSKTENINLFEGGEDAATSDCCDALLVDGQCSKCKGIIETADNYYNAEDDSTELTPLEEAIDAMLLPEKPQKVYPKGKLSIGRIIDEMDDIIGEATTSKKKVYSLV